jgi:cytochrome c oxidase subunit II
MGLNISTRRVLYFSIFSLLFFSTPSVFAAWQLNMPRGVTPISQAIFSLHMFVFWVCVGIAIVVFSILIFSLIRHRKSRGVTPATFHEHPNLEVAWAIVPLIILVVLAIPATRTLILMNNNEDSDLTIKVTGYQWYWRYTYLDQGIDFYSKISTPSEERENRARKNPWYLLQVDHPLVVPINKKIRFLFTSNDVIHSWWVPELGIKRDTLPGFINESWAKIEQVGVYRGQCAELCGVNHAFMPIVVEAVTAVQFNRWLKTQGVLAHDQST